MKKKELILVILMGVITIALITGGYIFSNNRKEALLTAGQANAAQQEQLTSEEAADKASESLEDLQKKLDMFAENRDAVPLADYLQYIHHHNDKVTVALFGDVSGNTDTAISQALENVKEDLDLEGLSVQTYSMDEKSSYDYVTENVTEELIQDSPDVIFYLMPTTIDQETDISLEESLSNNYEVFNQIKSGLPDSLILFITPYPLEGKEGVYNSRSLDYIDYFENLSEENKNNNLPTYNMHEDLTKYVSDNYMEISNLMNETGEELNEKGQEVYAELFEKNITNKTINTTMGRYVEGEKPAQTELKVEIEAESSEEESEEITESEESVEAAGSVESESQLEEEEYVEIPVEEEAAESASTDDSYYSEEEPSYSQPSSVPSAPVTPAAPAEESVTEPEPEIEESSPAVSQPASEAEESSSGSSAVPPAFIDGTSN